jgi:hypothetical protein
MALGGMVMFTAAIGLYFARQSIWIVALVMALLHELWWNCSFEAVSPSL